MTTPADVNGLYSPVLYNIQKDIGIRAKTGATKLKKLSPIHKKMIALFLSGVPANQISKITGKSYTYTCNVLKDPLAQAFIGDFDEMTRAEFDVLRRLANDAIRNGLQHKDINVNLRSADLFSKRAGDYHPKDKTTQETAEDVIQRMFNNCNFQFNMVGADQ